MNEKLVPPIEKTMPCPKCEGEMKYKLNWELRGRGSHKGGKRLVCYLYKCESCGATLRFPKIEEREEDT